MNINIAVASQRGFTLYEDITDIDFVNYNGHNIEKVNSMYSYHMYFLFKNCILPVFKERFNLSYDIDDYIMGNILNMYRNTVRDLMNFSYQANTKLDNFKGCLNSIRLEEHCGHYYLNKDGLIYLDTYNFSNTSQDILNILKNEVYEYIVNYIKLEFFLDYQWLKNNEQLIRKEVLDLVYKELINRLCLTYLHEKSKNINSLKLYRFDYRDIEPDSYNFYIPYLDPRSYLHSCAEDGMQSYTIHEFVYMFIPKSILDLSDYGRFVIEFINNDLIYRYYNPVLVDAHLYQLIGETYKNSYNDFINILKNDIDLDKSFTEYNYYYNLDIVKECENVNGKITLF